MRILLTLATLTVVAGSYVLGVEPVAEKIDPAFRPLIEQLGDIDYGARDRAFNALKQAGEKALPALRKAVDHDDLEIRTRARDLVGQVELNLLLSPKRVTLKVVHKTLPEVFQELKKQTGYRIECSMNKPDLAYSFDFADVTFWEAIDRIARDAGLTLQQTYNDATVRLQQVDGYAPHVSHDGAFRVVAANLQQFKQVQLGVLQTKPEQITRSDSLTLQFSLFSEPKLPMLGIGEVKLLAAYDSERNTMLPAPDSLGDTAAGPGRGRRASNYGGNRTQSHSAQVHLVRVSEKASSVKLLRASVPVTLLVEEKRETVTEKILGAKGTKKTFGTCTISIEDVQVQANKQVQVKLTVAEANHGGDYSWTNTLHQRLELFDVKGDKYSGYGSSWSSSSPAAIQATFTFGGLPTAQEPAKLIFHAWTTMQQDVMFEFKDLPLP